jgi:hypothetical protein
MKAYKHLVKYSLAAGHTVSVFDGEEWAVKKSTAYQTIISDIESVEEAEIVITDSEGRRIGWALVSAYGLADDETVIDFGLNDYMTEWEETYSIDPRDPAFADRDRLLAAARELATGQHGSFAAAIGDAATRADSLNLRKLAEAFPELFSKAAAAA